MANQIQEVRYEGYLVADPEMRFLGDGRPVTNFRMGSNRQYKDKKGEVIKNVTWVKVAVFGGLAEVINNICAKGSWVIVKGYLRPDPATGSPQIFQLKNGESASSYEVVADDIRVLKGKDFEDAEQPADSFDDVLPY